MENKDFTVLSAEQLESILGGRKKVKAEEHTEIVDENTPL